MKNLLMTDDVPPIHYPTTLYDQGFFARVFEAEKPNNGSFRSLLEPGGREV